MTLPAVRASSGGAGTAASFFSVLDAPRRPCLGSSSGVVGWGAANLRRARRCPRSSNRHDCPVRAPARRPGFPPAASLAPAVVRHPPSLAGRDPPPRRGRPRVRTVLGPGVRRARRPGSRSIRRAISSSPTRGHCRVLVVPAKAEVRYGVHLRAGRVATVAGGSCTGHGRHRSPERRGGRRPGRPLHRRGDGAARPGAPTDRPLGTRDGGGHGAGGLQRGRPRRDRQRAEPADVRRPRRRRRPLHRGHRQLPRPGAAGWCHDALRPGDGGGAPLHRGRHRRLRHGRSGRTRRDGAAVEPGGRGGRQCRRPPGGRRRRPVRAARGRRSAGTYYGTTVGAGDIAVVVGGTGSYGPYLADGLSATGPTAELNDPRGLAIGPSGALFVTDGFMHAVRVVPASDGTSVRPRHDGRGPLHGGRRGTGDQPRRCRVTARGGC